MFTAQRVVQKLRRRPRDVEFVVWTHAFFRTVDSFAIAPPERLFEEEDDEEEDDGSSCK